MSAEFVRVNLGNHAQGYECQTCWALSASQVAAEAHQEWHDDHSTRPGTTTDETP